MARIKGTALLPIVKTLRAAKDGARKVVPLPLHYYLEDRIIVFSWYPEEDFIELVRAASKLWPIGEDEFLEQLGRTSARLDLRGVYSNLLKEGDPLAMLRAGTHAWRLYHDTGRILVTPEGENQARVDLVGYGLPCREMCLINRGWINEEISLAGGTDTETVHSRCCCKGDSLCRWEVKWSGLDGGGASA